MELRHLRYFVAVAEELHFGRAAERLFMAQPPLSQQIRQLEKEMAVQLFERTNRRVELTPAGEVFLKDTRTILSQVETAVETARHTAKGESGWFGVGFVASAINDILPAILRRFREQYPEVELILLEISGVDQSEALAEKRIHVGFSRLPEEEQGIVHELVARDTLMVALPASNRLAGQEIISIASLAAEPLILYPHHPESTYVEYLLRLYEEAGFTPRIVQRTGEIQTAVSLVDAGIGVAIVPATTQNMQRENVVYRRISGDPTIELTMAYRRDDPSPILPHFLTIVRDVVSPIVTS